jgi:hypothetical protein
LFDSHNVQAIDQIQHAALPSAQNPSCSGMHSDSAIAILRSSGFP